MVDHSALVSSHRAEIKTLHDHGYRWANGDLDIAHGGLPDVPPGYSDAATNKYFLQSFDGAVGYHGSGYYVAERLLNRDFTPTEHNNWVSVFTQDIKHNGWTPAEVWLKFYVTVSNYPEVTTDLNGFQHDILGRTDGSYDTGWNTWAQNMMAHGYSLTEMRSNIAHSDAAQAALNAIYQADFSRNIDTAGLVHYQDRLANGWTLQQVRIEVAHSEETTQHLSQAITDIQGRPVTDGDNSWIRNQEDALAKNSITLRQIYQGTAIWTGEHGGYNGIIEGVQDRSVTGSDQPYIALVEQQIGSGEKTFQQVRNDLIDGTAQGSAEKMYNTFYGQMSNDDWNWYRDQLKSGKTTQQLWQQEAISPRMRTHVLDMINGVQDRTDAKEEWDGNYVNLATQQLTSREKTFEQIRDDLIDGTAHGAAEKMYNAFYGQMSNDDWNWYRDQLKSGKTTQQLWQQEEISPRMRTHVLERFH